MRNSSPVGIAVYAITLVLIVLVLWIVIYPLFGSVGCLITIGVILLGFWLLIREVRSHM